MNSKSTWKTNEREVAPAVIPGKHEKMTRIWRRIRKHWLGFLGACMFLGVVCMAVAAPLVAPFDPYRQDLTARLCPPLTAGAYDTRLHLLGTDHVGRDILSRVIYGSRISLVISLSAVTLALILGVFFGLVAGYFGGIPDSVLMRCVDMQLAFPFILLALAVVSLFGPSLHNIVIVFALTSWPVYARTVRGQVLSLKECEYIEAAKAVGATNRRILFVHLLPNVMSSILVIASYEVARMIIMESALGFLGLGIQPPIPTWGNMLSEGRQYIDSAWWMATFPGLAIMLAVSSINLMGDALRDLFDPRTQYV